MKTGPKADLLRLPDLIEPLFIAAGWTSSRYRAFGSRWPTTALDHGQGITDVFGGLQVGDVRAGTEVGAANVRFLSAPRLGESSGALCRWTSLGELVVFALAHNDYMWLVVDARGHFYVFTDVDGRLYDGGDDFGDLMRRLLWGYRLGPEVRKDE